MRQINQEGLQLIKRFESFAAQLYRCPAGLMTIGYGHVVRVGEDFTGGITQYDAEQLLTRDLTQATQAVLRYIAAPLSDGQYAALVSFTFNLGGGALQRSALRRKVNRGEHTEVPRELMRWVWADGRKLSGLVKRRQAEGAMYEGELQE